MKKKLVIAFAFLITLLSIVPAYAGENTEALVFDESINDYIKIEYEYFNKSGARVKGIDSNGATVYDYTLNLNHYYFYDNLKNEYEYFNSQNLATFEQNNQMTLYSSSIPNLCNGPDSQIVSIPLKVVTGGVLISSGIIAIKLSALISTKIGYSVSSIKSVGSGVIGVAAGDIYSSIVSGDWGRDVNFRINFSCQKMWESDPFEPTGGFWFYGMGIKDMKYLGVY